MLERCDCFWATGIEDGTWRCICPVSCYDYQIAMNKWAKEYGTKAFDESIDKMQENISKEEIEQYIRTLKKIIDNEEWSVKQIVFAKRINNYQLEIICPFCHKKHQHNCSVEQEGQVLKNKAYHCNDNSQGYYLAVVPGF